MNEERDNWRLLFVLAAVFVALVVVFALMHNGRATYPPLVP